MFYVFAAGARFFQDYARAACSKSLYRLFSLFRYAICFTVPLLFSYELFHVFFFLSALRSESVQRMLRRRHAASAGSVCFCYRVRQKGDDEKEFEA